MKSTAAGAAALLLCASTLFAQTPAPLDTALIEATRLGQCRDVAGLLKKGANPNARGKEGATPLMHASVACQAPILANLLDRGAEIDARDERGRTALIYAIDRDPPEGSWRKSQMDVIRLLLSRKASTVVKDEDGSTLVHAAAQQRNVDVLKLLLSLGLAADARNKDGATPLFFAAMSREPRMVEILLAAGADPNARINAGLSVLDIAQQRGLPEAVQILQARGARAGAAAAAPSRTPAADAPNLSPIDGITFEQWARANGRLTAGVPLEAIVASLRVDKARWERAHEQWTERLAANTLTIGTDYARHFKAAMEEEATKAGEPGTGGSAAPPISFEKWVEVSEASFAASERLPELYGMSRGDWTRVNSWWNQRLKTKQVDKAAHDRLTQKYAAQFAATPPVQSALALREGALEANREPMSLEKWVEIQQADAAAQDWTLKRQGLTMAQWIRATLYWGEKYNQAMLRLDTAPPAERAETQKMHAERTRLGEIYKKKYAQGVPW